MILKRFNQSLCLNRDWLSFSGQLVLAKGETPADAVIECPPGYTIELCAGTNVFNNRAYLINAYGVKVLTFQWYPKSRAMNRLLINFQVSNPVLYSWDLKSLLDVTYEIHNYTFLCITRLDICCDFEFSRRCRSIINGLYRGRLYVANKREGNLWWNKDAEEPFPHDLNFGSARSDFRWKIYDKSRELRIGKRDARKPYIWDEWYCADFNITNVWRVEVSMTKGSSLKYHGRTIDLQDVLSDAFICQMFSGLLESRFVIRRRQHHSRKSNDEVVDLLHFPIEGFKLDYPKLMNADREASISTQIGKLADLLQSSQIQAAPLIFSQIAASLTMTVAKYRLQSYFLRTYDCTVSAFIEQNRRAAEDIGELRGERTTVQMIGMRTNACWLRRRWLAVKSNAMYVEPG